MRAFSPLDHTSLSSTPPETAAFLVHRHGIREIAAMILALHQVFSLPSFKENEGPGGGTNAEKHGRLPDNTTLTNSVDELVDPDDPNGPIALSSFNNRSALQLWPPGVRPNTNTGERFGTPVGAINFLFRAIMEVRQPSIHYLQQTRVACNTYGEVKHAHSRHENIIT